MFSGQYYGSSFFDLVKDRGDLTIGGTKTGNVNMDMAGVPHATTILAVRYNNGVLIAGDRRATEGHSIADRRIRKVFKTDHYSAMAIAGAAGPCMEMAKLFAVELEHYEKMEGSQLSMEGKANKLSQMIRANLPMAMQGLVVVPIFAGYDTARQTGRIFKYDITGGMYEDVDFYATGSGGRDAKGSIKKVFRPDMTLEDVTGMALEALFDAADEDAATGGPDLMRNIFPIVVSIDRDGLHEKDEAEIRDFYINMIERKKS